MCFILIISFNPHRNLLKLHTVCVCTCTCCVCEFMCVCACTEVFFSGQKIVSPRNRFAAPLPSSNQWWQTLNVLIYRYENWGPGKKLICTSSVSLLGEQLGLKFLSTDYCVVLFLFYLPPPKCCVNRAF